MKSLPDTTVLSFRQMLTTAIGEFLAEHGPFDAAMADDVAETIVALARYREEGIALFPAVFFCDDVERLVSALGAGDPVVVGAGPCGPLTPRRALKQCAPLSRGSWAIFLRRHAEGYEFGVFRSDDFVLSDTIMSRLRAAHDASLRVLGIVQLGENILELRTGRGAGQLIQLSGALYASPATRYLPQLIGAMTRDADATLRGALGTFFRRTFIDAIRSSHGSLIAVVSSGGCDLAAFRDGCLLAEPLDVGARVAAFRRDPSADARSAVQSLSQLLAGMLSADGITVIATDGSIVGYNVFLHDGLDRGSREILGGARQRTYQALAEQVDAGALVAAFMRSQDGHVECRVDGAE